MRVASLDFGSNTTLLLVAEVKDGRVEEILSDETRITKMGLGVHQNKRFHKESLKRIEEALGDYKKIIDQLKPEKIVAVATSAARDVENSNELFALARNFGIEIKIIPGEEEARLTYVGTFSNRPEPKGVCVIDVGGGSTELIFRRDSDGKIIGESIDVGSVRLMDLFGEKDPMSQSDLISLRAYVRERLNPDWAKQKFKSAIAVAGTPTILAAMELGLEDFQADLIDGFVLKKEMIEAWLKKLQPLSLSEREKIKGLPPKRADVIVAGCAILLEFLHGVGLTELDVSVRGVRFGLAVD
jgi:exopolyphosphatase / guanosine-5'-triphosphate,3'-diphosphate pyrophosphatase